MAKNQKVELLHKIPLFDHLSKAALHKLAAITHEKSYEEGHVLFEEGEAGDTLFLIESGSALVQGLLDAQTRSYKDLAVVEAGSIFGEMALFDKLPRSATVRALTKLRVLFVTREEFQKFLHEDTSTAATILGGILSIQTARLREANHHLTTLHEISSIIASARQPRDLAKRVMERLIGAIFQVDAGAFCHWGYQDECDALCVIGGSPDAESKLCLCHSGPMAHDMELHPKPHTLRDLPAEHPLRSVFHIGRGDSVLMAPLIFDDKLLGFILLVGRKKTFSSFDEILVSAVCSPVASALTNIAYADDASARDRLETARLWQLQAQ